MKKIFKNLIFISAISVSTLPIVGCSNKTKTKESTTIEIITEINDLTVMEEETHVSKPIEAICYDQTGKEKKVDIQFSLKIDGNDKLPNWISLTDNNEIKLTGGKQTGEYNFSLYAYNEKEKVYSEAKTFKVNVIEERHILPDQIDISIENDRYCMYGDETILPIKVTPYKEGYDEKYLLKSCEFKLEVLSGQDKDLLGEPLFKFSDSNIDPNLIVSANTDLNFTDDYKIKITASLIDEPNVSISKDIDLHIDNIYYHYDVDSKYTYTRESVEDDWKLVLANPEKTSIKLILSKIQNKPVSKIDDNLCSKSGITKLISAILPASITTIGDGAFMNQSYFSSISMPGVKYVGENAFKNDSVLLLDSSKGIPPLDVVKNYAFYGCKKFNFNGEMELSWIGDFAFKNAGLSMVGVGENCTYIGQETFADCANLSSFTILTPEPPVLGGATFTNSTSLKTIHVLAQYVDIYQSNKYWSVLQQKIEGI